MDVGDFSFQKQLITPNIVIFLIFFLQDKKNNHKDLFLSPVLRKVLKILSPSIRYTCDISVNLVL